MTRDQKIEFWGIFAACCTGTAVAIGIIGIIEICYPEQPAHPLTSRPVAGFAMRVSRASDTAAPSAQAAGLECNFTAHP